MFTHALLISNIGFKAEKQDQQQKRGILVVGGQVPPGLKYKIIFTQLVLKATTFIQ